MNRLIVLFISLEFFVPVNSSSQHFTEVYSGTKSDIRKLVMISSSEGYFLTDKIFALDGYEWKKMEFPETRKIDNFFPLSSSDIWFSAALKTSTSMLYHYHGNIIENVRLPFSNLVSSIFFSSRNLGFFSGFFEGRFGRFSC